jgi:hypothetical protein
MKVLVAPTELRANDMGVRAFHPIKRKLRADESPPETPRLICRTIHGFKNGFPATMI